MFVVKDVVLLQPFVLILTFMLVAMSSVGQSDVAKVIAKALLKNIQLLPSH